MVFNKERYMNKIRYVSILFLSIFVSLFLACPGDELEKALEEAKFKLDQGFIETGSSSVTSTSLFQVLVCDSTAGTCPTVCDESKEDCQGETSSSDSAATVKTLKEFAAEARAILQPYFSGTTVDSRVAKKDKEFIRIFHVLYAETILGTHGVSFIEMGPEFMKSGETSSSQGESLMTVFDDLIPEDIDAETALPDFQLANAVIEEYNDKYKALYKEATTSTASSTTSNASNSTNLEVYAVQGLINFFIMSTISTVIGGGKENFETGKITDDQALAYIEAMEKTNELFAEQLGLSALVFNTLFTDSSSLRSQINAGGDASDIVDAYLATQYGK